MAASRKSIDGKEGNGSETKTGQAGLGDALPKSCRPESLRYSRVEKRDRPGEPSSGLRRAVINEREQKKSSQSPTERASQEETSAEQRKCGRMPIGPSAYEEQSNKKQSSLNSRGKSAETERN